MEEKYVYISISASVDYVDLNEKLNPHDNEIGLTWSDYLCGKWILLNEEQIAFRDHNPSASIKEVFDMQLDPVQSPENGLLEIARKRKLQEIEEQDMYSNKFFISVTKGGAEINNVELWIDKDLRNSLYSITLPALQKDGETVTKLWATGAPPVSIEVPVSWALEKLPLLEIYAKKTYDIRSKNEASVYNAATIEEIGSIDVISGYPLFLTFELNLDL